MNKLNISEAYHNTFGIILGGHDGKNANLIKAQSQTSLIKDG